jgi:hypothetical protein
LPVDAPAGRLGSGKHAEGHPHPSSLKENKRAAVCGIANSRPVAAHEIRAAVCNNPGSRHMFGLEGHGPGGGEFHGVGWRKTVTVVPEAPFGRLFPPPSNTPGKEYTSNSR